MNTIVAAVLAVAATSQAGRAARELAVELVQAIFRAEGKKVATEVVEGVVSRYGDDAARAIGKSGSAGVEVLRKGSSRAMLGGLERGGKEFAQEALAHPSAVKEALERCGPEAAELIARHPGSGAKFLARTGKEGLEAARGLSGESLEKMAGLLDRMEGTGKLAGFLKALSRFGDGAADYIWRNKGGIFVLSAAAAFVADPEKFMKGTLELGKAGVSAAGAVFPLRSILALAVLAAAAWVGFKVWLWRRSRQAAMLPSPP